MEQPVQLYGHQQLTIIYTCDEGGWVAQVREFPGAVSQAGSRVEAFVNVVDALHGILQVELERRDDLPTTEELIGVDPDFTGDLSTDEYVRQLRDD